MQKLSINAILSIVLVLSAAVFFAACDNKVGSANSPADTAATVNGKAVKNEEVEKIIKAQFQGQETKLSPLELKQARLVALDNLIQQEVMFQKAEKEKTLPTDDEVNQEFNTRKQQSGVSAEEFAKRLQEAGETEQSLRENLRKQLAIKKLGDKISSSVEPPKDSEIDAFYKGNPAYFIKKRGASLKAIVLNPQDTGEGDATKNQQEVQLRLGEIANKLKQGTTFEALAAEYSEDQTTKLRSGDWRDFSEEEMKQAFGDGFADFVMNKSQVGAIIPQPIPFQGSTLIVKIAAKQEKDENLTLESPNVKPQIIELLTNAKKQLLTQAYQAISMDEARIDNLLAKSVVQNPNESGARPADPNAVASPATPASSPVAAANTNAANAAPAASPAAKANANAAR